MRLMLCIVALSALLLVACGSSSSDPSSASPSPALASLPATLDGAFAAIAGGIEPDGSEYFLGGLSVRGEEVSVKVGKAVVDSVGMLPSDGGLPTTGGAKIRATLDSKNDFLGEPVYVVSAMQRL